MTSSRNLIARALPDFKSGRKRLGTKDGSLGVFNFPVFVPRLAHVDLRVSSMMILMLPSLGFICLAIAPLNLIASSAH